MFIQSFPAFNARSAAALLVFLKSSALTSELGGASLRVVCCTTLWSLSHIRFDFAGHKLESLVNILALFGRGLEESNTVVVCHLLAFFERDSSLRLQISLVSDQYASNVVLGVLLDFAHPCVHRVEGVSVGDVVGHDDTVGSLVIGGGDSLKALLSGSELFQVALLHL